MWNKTTNTFSRLQNWRNETVIYYKWAFPLKHLMCYSQCRNWVLHLISTADRKLKKHDSSKDLYRYQNFKFWLKMWGKGQYRYILWYQIKVQFLKSLGQSCSVLVVHESTSASTVDAKPQCHSSQNGKTDVDVTCSYAVLTSTLKVTDHLPISGLKDKNTPLWVEWILQLLKIPR